MMQAWHQKNMLESDFPFRLWVSGYMEFGPHWHQEIEVIYMLEGTMQVGLNSRIYTLKEKDILLIGGGDIHYFLPQHQWGKKLFVQFGLSLFDTHSAVMSDRRFIHPLLSKSTKLQDSAHSDIHRKMEKQILLLLEEYEKKQQGYRMALKARLYDLMVMLLRHIPSDNYSVQEKNNQQARLERLEKVFQFVEENYDRAISLQEVAAAANFSVYHFTRFFKEAMGMTFVQYLNHYRIKRSERYLTGHDESVADIAYQSGFSSIQTFNRVFKQINGCSPSEYRKNNIARFDK